MIQISEAKRTALNNALATGLSPESAYLFANLTADEMEAIQADDEEQAAIANRVVQVEQMLLQRMMSISMTQATRGRESATTWLLEKMFPRYAGRPQADIGEIHLHMGDPDLDTMDTVEIHEDLL